MDIKYLNYILTIAEERNLHKAAEKLYISQPSLSQYLLRLETELGTPLFRRCNKELIPTEAGRLYIETARTVVNLRNKLYRDISNLTYQSHLSIATASQWGTSLISRIMPEFKAKHPDVMIEVTESFFPSMSFRLKREEIDICLASIAQAPPDYKIIFLGQEEIKAAVSSRHPFCSQHDPEVTRLTPDILLRSFSEENFLLTSKGSSTQFLVERLFQSIHFYPRIFGYFDNINTILQLVEAGTGVSFVPVSCINENAHISYYSMETPLYRQHIAAYRKDLDLTPPVKELFLMISDMYQKYLKSSN